MPAVAPLALPHNPSHSMLRNLPHAVTSALPAWQLLCSRLLAQLLEPACIVDATSQQLLAGNPAAEALLGAAPAGLLDRPVHELCPALEDECFWADPALCGPQGTGLHSDSLVRHADGRLLDVERRLAPLPLPDGRQGWLLTWRDLGERRMIEAELDQLAAQLLAGVAGAAASGARPGPGDALLVTDLSGAVRAGNPAFARLWQLPDDPLPGRDDARLAALLRGRQADPAAYDRRLADLTQDPRASATDHLLLSDGRCIERRCLPQYGRGRLIGRLWVWRDITQAQADEARARLALQVFEISLDAILVTDGQRRIVAANAAAALLLGRDEASLQADTLDQLLLAADAHDDPAVVERALARAERDGHWAGALALRPGGQRPGAVPAGAAGGAALASATALATATATTPVYATLQWRGESAASGCLVILHDRSADHARQAAVHQLLQLDLLTGLPNRQRLGQRLAELLDTAAPVGGPGHDSAGRIGDAGAQPGDPAAPSDQAAMLIIGLERFTALNDALGHGGGDRVLIEVGMRLANGVGERDMVTRLGADSFAVLLADADSSTAAATARHLQAALGAGMSVDGLDFVLNASIGIACCPGDGRSLDDLLRHADSAMQRARQRTGGDLCFYQPRMTSDLLPRIRLDHAMRQGLVAGAFRLQYQPQIDLASGRIVGAEALLRWRDPQQGEIPPGRFIPVAEETGFIVELGLWVMAEALAQAGRWRAAGLALPLSVNVSALQFQQPGFVDQVAALLAGNGVPAAMLELELTESVLLGDIDAIVGQLDRLAALGVRLAIDDFGTGYSGLSYLKRLPIHRLKIDRSFVKDLPGDASDAAITRSVIELARALHLQVIAEGVETEAQRAYLAGLGCHEYQGWLYAPALEAPDFAARVAAQPPPVLHIVHTPGRDTQAVRLTDAAVDPAATLAA